jgi:hypothetical protein
MSGRHPKVQMWEAGGPGCCTCGSRRNHNPPALPQPDPRGPLPLAEPSQDHLVPILQEPAALTAGEGERLRAAPGELQEAAA